MDPPRVDFCTTRSGLSNEMVIATNPAIHVSEEHDRACFLRLGQNVCSATFPARHTLPYTAASVSSSTSVICSFATASALGFATGLLDEGLSSAFWGRSAVCPGLLVAGLSAASGLAALGFGFAASEESMVRVLVTADGWTFGGSPPMDKTLALGTVDATGAPGCAAEDG